MRNRFDTQLNMLNQEMIQMSTLCEQVINLVVQALTENDLSILRQVHTVDDAIDGMERSIETLCLKLLLQQQPVAKDLRQVSAALKIITDLERIGDQAADIADIVSKISNHDLSQCKIILQMAQASIKLLTVSVDAYVRRDVALAQKAIKLDDVIDALFVEAKTTLIEILHKDPDAGEYALDVLMIAKYFERIGDHATNVAEWVVFAVTGLHKDDNYENLVPGR